MGLSSLIGSGVISLTFYNLPKYFKIKALRKVLNRG